MSCKSLVCNSQSLWEWEWWERSRVRNRETRRGWGDRGQEKNKQAKGHLGSAHIYLHIYLYFTKVSPCLPCPLGWHDHAFPEGERYRKSEDRLSSLTCIPFLHSQGANCWHVLSPRSCLWFSCGNKYLLVWDILLSWEPRVCGNVFSEYRMVWETGEPTDHNRCRFKMIFVHVYVTQNKMPD